MADSLAQVAERLVMEQLLADGVSHHVAAAIAAAVASTLPHAVEIVADGDVVALGYSDRESSAPNTTNGSPDVYAVTLHRSSA